MKNLMLSSLVALLSLTGTTCIVAHADNPQQLIVELDCLENTGEVLPIICLTNNGASDTQTFPALPEGQTLSVTVLDHQRNIVHSQTSTAYELTISVALPSEDAFVIITSENYEQELSFTLQ